MIQNSCPSVVSCQSPNFDWVRRLLFTTWLLVLCHRTDSRPQSSRIGRSKVNRQIRNRHHRASASTSQATRPSQHAVHSLRTLVLVAHHRRSSSLQATREKPNPRLSPPPHQVRRLLTAQPTISLNSSPAYPSPASPPSAVSSLHSSAPSTKPAKTSATKQFPLSPLNYVAVSSDHSTNRLQKPPVKLSCK